MRFLFSTLQYRPTEQQTIESNYIELPDSIPETLLQNELIETDGMGNNNKDELSEEDFFAIVTTEANEIETTTYEITTTTVETTTIPISELYIIFWPNRCNSNRE